MIFALSIFAIFAFYTVFFTEDEYEKTILLIPVSILTLYSGTRLNVGGYDYSVYEYFYNLPYLQNTYGYEPLFVILRNFFKYLNFNYHYFLFALTIIFNFILYRLIIKYSRYPILSFFIYLSSFYYWHNFSIIRNYIAILIFWISLKYIKERKFIYYFILITIAYFFHQTAIILYPLYFLLNYRFSKKTLSLLGILALSFNPISFFIFKIDFNILNLYERLNRYIHIVESGNLYDFTELFIFVLILLFLRKDISDEENIIINLNLISLFIFITFYRFAVVLRILEYFRLGFFISIPFILSKIKDKNIKYLSFILICIYFTFRYYNIVLGYGVNHYQSWLFL